MQSDRDPALGGGGAAAAAGGGAAGAQAQAASDAPKRRQPFLCGVVEGFYGRPWTTEQRRDLFAKMRRWGMTGYLYAPKDDCKHRAYWRELYTVEEAEHLQSLIALARACQVDFYYALSPGLDITYSSQKELAALKRKLDQVSRLGCRAFALLFDDIEPEMCRQDKEAFQSFAHAQVAVTNDVYAHLGQPAFLFCPTQYCSARAVPCVRNSEYLTTIGDKLAPDINIMWTGDKVISKLITSEGLEDINNVLKRPVVIWDNEHANDYDQKRVYLGPYSGRSPELIQKLAGVMTNPNCEYNANFIGIHTLAQWSKCSIDGTRPHSAANDVVSADIKLEIQQDGEEDDSDPIKLPSGVYHPDNALVDAIKEWIPEFSKQKTVWGPMSKPQVGLTVPTLIPTVNTCINTTGGLAELPPTLAPPVGNPAEVTGQKLASHDPEQPASNTLHPPDVPKSLLPGAAVTTAAINGLIPLPLKTPSVSGDEGDGSGVKDKTEEPEPVIEANLGGACPSSILQPISLPLMNSLVSTNKVVVDHGLLSATTAAAPIIGGEGGEKGVVPVKEIVPPGLGGPDSVATVASIVTAAAVPPPHPPPAPLAVVATDSTEDVVSSTGATESQMEGSAVAAPAVATTVRPSASAIEAASVALGSSVDDDALMAPVVAAAAATQIAVGLAAGTEGASLVPPAPAPPIVPVPPDIIPGPTYLEPMDCQGDSGSSPNPSARASSDHGGSTAGVSPRGAIATAAGVGSSQDVHMESMTNPPTPASGTMQVEHGDNPSAMHKSESSTMLCDDDHAKPAATAVATVVPVLGDNVTNNPEVTTMLCDDVVSTDPKAFADTDMTVKDLLLLCQLFYLPSDHGRSGISLLEDFFWLKRFATSMLPPGSPGAGTPEDRREWEIRAAKFKQSVCDIHTLFVKLCACQNRELVYDLYTYLWDMCGVVQTLEGFVQWMSKGACSPKSQHYVVGQQTWFSGMREAFLSGDHEPWMFRGGLISDLQRLLPLDSGNDLYFYKFPDVPAPQLWYVRPFQPRDEDAVYAVAAEAYERGVIGAPMGLCPADRDLIGDRDVGAYLTLCPEFSFVCESSLDGSIVGFACAAPDARVFYNRSNVAWLPEMRRKYPAKTAKVGEVKPGEVNGSSPPTVAATPGDEEMLTPLEQMAQTFHAAESDFVLPEFCTRVAVTPTSAESPAAAAAAALSATASSPWGLVHMRISPTVTEGSLPKRLTSLTLASLRASGTFRVFSEADGAARRDFYANLGFRLVGPLPPPAATAPALPTVVPAASPTSSTSSVGALAAAAAANVGIVHMTRSF